MAESTYKILVADDDEMIRTLHAEFVRGFGYDVEVAANTLVSTARDTGFAVIYRDAAALSTNQAPDDFLFDPRMSNVKEIRLIVR